MNKPAGPARGRRPGQPETRAEILEVARRRFLADGYQATTLRAIATDAGVDVALVSYFFGSKKGLFGAVLGLMANPPELVLRALPGEPAHLPERILRALLAAWDDPETGGQLQGMARLALQDPGVARLLREVVTKEMHGRLAEYLGGSQAEARAAAFGTQLVGLIMARYILVIDPIASMTTDELLRHLLPGLRAALYPPTPRRSPR